MFKNKRFHDITISLNPFNWFSKPHYYRFNWQKAESPVREGQLDFGPISYSWYKEPKNYVPVYNTYTNNPISFGSDPVQEETNG